MKKKYFEPNINTQMFKTEAYLAEPGEVSAEIETVPEVTSGDPFAPFAY